MSRFVLLDGKLQPEPLLEGLPAPGDLVDAERDGRPRPVVVLVDPRPLRRACIEHLLKACVPDHMLVAVSEISELTASSDIERDHVRLVVVSVGGRRLSRPDMRESLHTLVCELPEVPVVVVSDREDSEDVVEACRCGVRGYIPTSLQPQVAREVLHLIEAGGYYIPAECLIEVADNGRAENGGGEARADGRVLDGLTPRQNEVLVLLCQGKPNKVIAQALGMEESTVKVHVRHIMRKLGARNRTEVALRAGHRMMKVIAG